MSDPRLDVELKVGDDVYTLRFTNAALALAEKWTGKQVGELAMVVGAGRFGFYDLVRLTGAGLEGARRKLRLSPHPWTLEKVEDLLEDAGSFHSVAEPVIEAFDAALRKWFPDEFAEGDEAGEGDAGPSGSGTDSLELPSEQD